MRAVSGLVWGAQIRGAVNQILMVILINVPAVSFGLALGWVSLVSGEAGGEGHARAAVVASMSTFAATFLGVPLSAKAITYGRKFAVIATSAGFVVCWSLKLVGGWWMLGGRVAAGLAGASSWVLAPLLAREMCSEQWRGAAVSALPLAHNLGVLVMYIAADAKVQLSTVFWWCLGLSITHCFLFMLVPESPSFLAAKGKYEEARASLAWLRGRSPLELELEVELKALPPPETDELSSFKLAKEMLSDRQRRFAFIVGGVAVVGQEVCGVLAIMQYAERLFLLTRDQTEHFAVNSTETAAYAKTADLWLGVHSPSQRAIVLGAVQLVASALSLYLVEKVGRRPLIVWGAWGVGAALACSTVLLAEGGGERATRLAGGAALAIVVAVAIDAVGLQPAPYALLGDMFHYQYRSCALMLVTATSSLGNVVEVGILPLVASQCGVVWAVGLAAGFTLAYALFATLTVPETRMRSVEEIYDELCPRVSCGEVTVGEVTIAKCSETVVCTKL
ncbi:probable metabolite transport protein CsbC [Leptidea sinapis]|uniref:probable metabolite transport protein CsbC n=1 Tax=Leptidea sinapis TaxID=189913 RepID=UPI0021340F57|nr:probable metabolite transport protein CsbC [Leptidea sinapis]